MPAPFVSVIVPVHNYERYIGAALESVLAQRFAALETIVVDDGSSDASAEIARQYADTVIVTEHRGVSRARNVGLAAARGSLIAFLDADDTWTHGSLSARVEHLRSNPDLDFVVGAVRQVIEGGDPALSARAVGTEPGWAFSAFLVRRRLCEQTGSFDESLVIGEDLDWIARAQEAGGRGASVPFVTVLKRLHPGCAVLRHAGLARQARTQVIRKALMRQRAARSAGLASSGPRS